MLIEPYDAAKDGPWARGPERILLKHGLVTLDQLEWAAKQPATGPGSSVLRTLVDLGQVDETLALQAVAADCKLPFMRISTAEVDKAAFALLPPEDCQTLRSVPIRRDGEAIVVATADPVNVFLADNLRRQLKGPIRFIVTPRCDLERIIEDLCPGRGKAADILKGITTATEEDVEVVREQAEEVANLERLASESPVSKAATTTKLANTPTRCRRTNFRSLYAALGGPAKTGSFRKCRSMSSAKSLAVA